MTKAPVNLLDSRFQHKTLKLTDVEKYKNMSFYYTNEFCDEEDNREVSKSISQSKVKNKNKRLEIKHCNDDQNETNKNIGDRKPIRLTFMFKYKVTK